MTRAFTEESTDPRDLLLDANNPRLPPSHRGASQTELLRILINRFRIEELADSIIASGYTDVDPLIGYQSDEGIIIREGNRRLAALKLLLEPEKAPTRQQDKWYEYSRSYFENHSDPLTHVTVRVYPSAEHGEIEAYIGFRHVSGVMEWPAREKARFISDLIEAHGWSYKEIARRIGSYPKHVERHYIASKLIEQCDEEGIEGVEYIRIGTLLRALQAGGIPEFLGIQYTGDPADGARPVPGELIDNLRFFVRATFGTDSKEAILPESRQITKWGHILQSEEAVKYLKTSEQPRFERAYIKSGGQRLNVEESLAAAANNLEDVSSVAADYVDDEGVRRELARCQRRLNSIIRDFGDLDADG